MIWAERRRDTARSHRSHRARVSVLALIATMTLVSAHADTSYERLPDLGERLDARQSAALPPTLYPDGHGLPSGSGTAELGRRLYAVHCEACHGPAGIGLSAPALAGNAVALTERYPDITIGSYWPYTTTLFDFLQRAKPMEAPGRFDANELYALCAYLLELNGLLDRSTNEPLDAAGLRAIVMPNRNGFDRIDDQPKRP